MAPPSKEFTSFGENLFGLIAEAEESFLAAGLAAAFGEGEDFVGSHEMGAGLAGVLAEGTVAAIIAAEGGERNEDFL